MMSPPAHLSLAMIPSSGKHLRKTTLDWASLDQGLLEFMGSLVLAGDLQDYVSFRAVCLYWRASTVCPQGRGVLDPRFHPRRWMMLPEGHGLYPGHPDLRGFVRFFNLKTGAVVRVHLPLLEDHAILDSVDGLLLLHRDHDTAIRLLNPFTGDMAELPPLMSLLPQMEPYRCFSEKHKRSFLMKVSAAVACGATGTVTIMMALPLLHRVAYASTGDQRWTLSAWKLQPLVKPVSFQGKLYSIKNCFVGTRKMQIFQIDPPRPDALSHLPSPQKIVECQRVKIYYARNLVECGSELLIIGYKDASCRHMVIYRLSDLVSGKFVPVTSIGDNTLFLDERCLCVSPCKGLPSILSNSIICIRSRVCDPNSQELDRFEQYNIETGIWTPASDGDIVQTPPPSPHTLIHHIFTCCHRNYWNKGIMFCRQIDADWLVNRDLRLGA